MASVQRFPVYALAAAAAFVLACPPAQHREPTAERAPDPLARRSEPERPSPPPPPKKIYTGGTRYLHFQIFTGTSDPKFPGKGDRVFTPPSRAKLHAMAQTIVDRIGTTGDARNKLGFTLGPMAFDHTDAETVQLIGDGFAIAEELDLSVAFHIDDSLFWASRRNLWQNPANVEWLDWKGTPNTGRRIDWGPEPTQLKPQMCFNSPEIAELVRDRATLIGREIAKGLANLRAKGKAHLYAGVIAGSETEIGRDFETGRYLGYCGLTNKGFSAENPPADLDRARTQLVQEHIERWARALAAAGVPKDSIYAHIVFTSQGLDDEQRIQRASYAERVHFATPDVAFSDAYRPGVSTYPSPGTFATIYEELEKRGTPPWASAEGTNIVPNAAPGEATMETYLGRMFNHGAALVNIFSWGLGGEALKDNMFRRVTENDEAIAAYRKFLRGEPLVEDPVHPFSMGSFRAKIERIQREMPSWVQRTRDQKAAEAVMKRLDAQVRKGDLYKASGVADEAIDLIESK
jgi:hypothetical protein